MKGPNVARSTYRNRLVSGLHVDRGKQGYSEPSSDDKAVEVLTLTRIEEHLQGKGYRLAEGPARHRGHRAFKIAQRDAVTLRGQSDCRVTE